MTMEEIFERFRKGTHEASDTFGYTTGTLQFYEKNPNDLAALSAQLFRWARAHADLKIIPAVERELIINALKETHGNQVQAAKLLGITRATLRKRIEKFGIKQELNVG